MEKVCITCFNCKTRVPVRQLGVRYWKFKLKGANQKMLFSLGKVFCKCGHWTKILGGEFQYATLERFNESAKKNPKRLAQAAHCPDYTT